MIRKLEVVLIVLLVFSGVIFADDLTVVYPNRDGLGEKAFGYQLLQLILPKTGKAYKLVLDKEATNQDRAFSELEKGVFSVVDSGIGPEFESKFDAVYIPIDRGLLGWRIFIINKKQQEDFSKIKTLEQLKTKIAGQGIGWTDGLIIEKSGIRVQTSAKIENLINMVDAGRFDFFPLGVNETHGFLAQFGKGKPNLVVEDTLVLAYPFARLFYVKKGNKVLHDDIKMGLEKAYSDGSFQKFIENHPFFKEGLTKANLKKRTIIRINNPFMTEKFKKIDPKWWYIVE